MENTIINLQEQVCRIERNTLLASKKALTLEDVSLLSGYSKSKIYKMTMAKEIPYYKPNGKTIFFDKEEVEAYLLQGRVATKAEAEEQAAAYCINTKKRGKRS